jgi:hypothetical protein
MSLRTGAIAAVVLPLVILSICAAAAGDIDSMPVKAKAISEVPFFLVNDNRLTYSYIFSGTDPGTYSVRPDGSYDGKTAKQTYSFTHFDVWKYGTNLINVSMYKSDHNDPASPCTQPGVLLTGAKADCAGATQIYGMFRSTFGFNEIFNTKSFSVGPLHNVSLEIGADASTQNTYFAPDKRALVAGLQFAFDLPYKGYFNVAPLYYKEINHKSFAQCGLFGPGTPGVTCLADGNVDYNGTWAVAFLLGGSERCTRRRHPLRTQR